ncbi:MAG: C40 family peptidase [Paludibacteraceae bacterium]|nr:C40 family peptidase [Paludibacteraceae bacterium]
MEHAIILHSIVPVRAEAREGAEQNTQLLFGELCEVINTLPRWMRVRNEADNEEGFVDSKMVTLLSEQEYASYAAAQAASTARVALPMTYAVSANNGQTLPLTMGTRLANYHDGQFDLLGVSFRIDATAVAEQPLPLGEQTLMQVTRFLLNTPYLWGGKNALGMDCSGLTQTVMSLFGIGLPRNASQQVKCGKEIKNLQDGKAGDLVFFDHADPNNDNTEPNNCKGDTRITHVGILLNSQRVIHCSGRVKIEHIDPRGIFGAEQRVYTHHLAAIRRMV